MADDIVFELLHSEIINYALEQNKITNGNKVKKNIHIMTRIFVCNINKH